MGKKANQAPFGITFAESVPTVRAGLVPVYDEDTDLSYVETLDGQRTPFVEISLQRTQTFTKVRQEETDADPSIRTGTETREAPESADSD